VQGGNAVFAPAPDLSEARKEGLGPAELTVLSALDGERNVSALVGALGLGLFETCKTLAELAGQGLVERTAPGNTPLRDPISGDALPSETQAAQAPRHAAAPRSGTAPAGWPGGTSRGMVWMGMGALLLALSAAVWLALNGPAGP